MLSRRVGFPPTCDRSQTSRNDVFGGVPGGHGLLAISRFFVSADNIESVEPGCPGVPPGWRGTLSSLSLLRYRRRVGRPSRVPDTTSTSTR
eukprot:3936400-Rhodomonas_salina.1